MAETRKTSTAKLSPEKREFYSKVLARATSPWGDATSDARDATGNGRKLVPVGQPHLSYILFSLIPIDAPDCPTMGVDKHGRLYINFDAYMNPDSPIYGLDSATKSLNHEPYHLLYRHMDRFESLPTKDPVTGHRKNHKAWNYAGDLTINQGIRHLVPDWALHVGEKGPYKDFPFNLSSEEYYQMIKDQEDVCPDCWQPKEPGDSQEPKDNSGSGDKSEDESGNSKEGGKEKSDSSSNGSDGDEKSDGSKESTESGSQGESNEAGNSSEGSGSSEGDSQEGNGSGSGSEAGEPQSGSGSPGSHSCPGCGKEVQIDCGSGGSGEPAEWELDPDEAPVISDGKMDDLRKATAEEIRKQENGKPGTMPGHLLVWAEKELKAPLPDWKSALRADINKGFAWKRGKMDYSYSRPNRRNQNPKIVFPALRSPKVRVALAIDTSGSNLHNLGLVAANTEEISRQSGCRGRDFLAFSVDAKADTVKPVNNASTVLEDMRGGGGTDMRVAFEVFQKLNRQGKADVGILLTDLETPWPSAPPKTDMKFIVVGVVDSPGENNHWVKTAQKALKNWATLLIIEPEQFEN